jgi:hypothetical protein
MITILMSTAIARARRKKMEAQGMTEEQIDDQVFKETMKMVGCCLLIMFGVLVYNELTCPYSYFHKELVKMFCDPAGYWIDYFSWVSRFK